MSDFVDAPSSGAWLRRASSGGRLQTADVPAVPGSATTAREERR